MSNEMFTQLPVATNAQLTDIICAVQGFSSPTNPGTSVQETLGQVTELISGNIIANFAGNPNGHVAGIIYKLCWDTTDSLLFICTTSGAASTAVWTPVIGQLTDGQLRIGASGTTPAANTLTAGVNVTITNTPGNITISSSGSGGGFTWTDVTSSPQAMLSNNGYIIDNGASLVTLTLPATSIIGDQINIVGKSSGGWSVTYSTGQSIVVGNAQSTTTSGSVSSTNGGDSMILICTTANLTWTALSVVSAGLTIV